MKQLALLIFLCVPAALFAGIVSGTIKDTKGNTLAFSSILIKGSTKGITANSKGFYSLQVNDGEYTFVCQHVGFKSMEKKGIVTSSGLTLDFELEEQQYKLNDVVIKSNAEDPAYAIIRKAIKKRRSYENELKHFETEVYVKGQLNLRNYPDKFLGQKIDFEDGDTSKKKMLFLSESVARYSVDGNNKKIEVLSTKVSGQSDGFGFANPQIVSFYNNIIVTGRGLNPRGFISPIADNALGYYRYKFKGTFYENGKEISRIQVIPKRKYEPLFTGYLNIIEDEWRLQSVQLTLLKEQQMQLLDTLKIDQLYMPYKNTWVIKQQVIEPAGKFFSFDFFGSFVQVYDKFNEAPDFKKKFFDNTILKYDDSSNKKPLHYWDSVRPVPLLAEEVKDYKKKDSLEQARKDPHYLDSLDKRRNKITFNSLIVFGQNFSNEKRKENISLDPLIYLAGVEYNSVEGRTSKWGLRYQKQYKGRRQLSISPNMRYGFHNRHFNGFVNSSYNYGKKYVNNISLSGGTNVFQFNNSNPISENNNTLSTYFWQHNYMKIYEAAFAKADYSKGFGDGFTAYASLQFQDRKPLENTIDSLKGKAFTPNYPTDITSQNISRHKAFTATAGISWKPGTQYIELPDQKIALGSKYPTFNLSVTQGIYGLFGSDVDYTKWKFSIYDNLHFNLGGRLSYQLEAGGFINTNKVFVPDYTHFLGNQTVIASEFLNSFQLLPYYKFSNISKSYFTAHVEYHLDGLLTNKIPLLQKWNWFFVVGANALYVTRDAQYYEAFFAIENIFKIARVDFIMGYQTHADNLTGIRIAIPLLFRK